MESMEVYTYHIAVFYSYCVVKEKLVILKMFQKENTMLFRTVLATEENYIASYHPY